MAFTGDIYAVIREGCLRSAQVVVPMVMDLLDPSSVIDVGCGEGLWLSVFAQHGAKVTGIDGGQGRLAIPSDSFLQYDLSTVPAFHLGAYDLAVCLEVAEHLPPARADWLVDVLCDHAEAVLFSAAIPGQGGTGHVHERWPGYWVSKFEERGYQVSGALRWRIWDQVPPVENWYAQNLLVALKDPGRLPELFTGDLAKPFPVVHPVLWDSRR